MFAIKVEVSAPWAEMLAFSAQETMYVQSALPARVASRRGANQLEFRERVNSKSESDTYLE